MASQFSYMLAMFTDKLKVFPIWWCGWAWAFSAQAFGSLKIWLWAALTAKSNAWKVYLNKSILLLKLIEYFLRWKHTVLWLCLSTFVRRHDWRNECEQLSKQSMWNNFVVSIIITKVIWVYCWYSTHLVKEDLIMNALNLVMHMDSPKLVLACQTSCPVLL